MTVYNFSPTVKDQLYYELGLGVFFPWAEGHDAGAATGDDTVEPYMTGVNESFPDLIELRRSFLKFDISSIPGGEVISSAALTVTADSSLTDLSVGYQPTQYIVLTSANALTPANSDYGLTNLNSTKLSSDLPYSDAASGVKTFAFNTDGITYLSGVSTAILAFRAKKDFDNDSSNISGRQYFAFSGTGINLQIVTTIPGPPDAPSLLTASCSVYSQGPQTNFSASVSSGTTPLTVNFTDLSQGTPTSWAWDFGDGSTSTSQNPSHTFTEAGIYVVKLTATNALGATDFAMTIIVSDADAPTFGDTTNPVVRVGVAPGMTLHGLIGKIGFYEVDTDGNQVKIYDRDGSLLKAAGGAGTDNGKFWIPTSCAVINGRQLLDLVQINEEEA